MVNHKASKIGNYKSGIMYYYIHIHIPYSSKIEVQTRDGVKKGT
jgi:hypothetical protein